MKTKKTWLTVLAVAVLLTGVVSAVTRQPTLERTAARLPTQTVTTRGTPIVREVEPSGFTFLRTPDSDCFSGIGYDSDRNELIVVFQQSGAVYSYTDVPGSVWRELREADSAGRYYNASIKGKYPGARLDGWKLSDDT